MVTLILIWVVIEDMRRFRIRNVAVLALCAAFGLDCVLDGHIGRLLPHGLFAAAGLLLLAAAFGLGVMGGGDAKLLVAALLWFGPEESLPFAGVLFASTLGYGLGAWLGWLPSRLRAGRMVIPFGASIAMAWIAILVLTTRP
ncbi:prepilin peptidase [uncultured Enterovirga sp.]|uniref:prepilin peptidase n=1 Tax=uncultured Enterovirga sp. TaxID=2026352 RepID=UPI0035CC2978